ncbi:pentapeptide repeat-containing protein [uncultured Litoreibacter sp.]|uniref:pentapeptide repeat-containing protein n=1 Tax=uncultured Litoreibacter sp. TaxID=1392394 RepID=UPI0026339A68|nr:pentapeptide repeat-containing protein [uncultured Litoreibacter sp.]
MKRAALLALYGTLLLAGFIAGAGGGGEVVATLILEYGGLLAAFALFGLAALAILLILMVRMARHQVNLLLGYDKELTENETADSIVELFEMQDELSTADRQARLQRVSVSLITWFLKREAARFYFTIAAAVVGGVIGLATLMLLSEQNKKIERQTQRIALQTDANIAQTILLDGVRQASTYEEILSLTSSISQTASTIEDECDPGQLIAGIVPDSGCWALEGLRDSERRYVRLPPDLTSRILAFSRRSTPYIVALPIVQDIDFEEPLRNQYRFAFLSPERGQLLETLVENQVWVVGGDYSFAQLDGTDLSGAYISGVDLSRASMNGTELSAALLVSLDMRGASLRSASLDSSYIFDTFMMNVDLTDARLSGAELAEVALNDAKLNSTGFGYASIRESDLQNTTINQANFTGAQLDVVDFTGATIQDVMWDGAWSWKESKLIGLPEALPILLCDLDVDSHDYDQKPEECG